MGLRVMSLVPLSLLAIQLVHTQVVLYHNCTESYDSLTHVIYVYSAKFAVCSWSIFAPNEEPIHVWRNDAVVQVFHQHVNKFDSRNYNSTQSIDIGETMIEIVTTGNDRMRFRINRSHPIDTVYEYHEERISWSKADGICSKHGGTLITSYPKVLSTSLKAITMSDNTAIWLDKALSNWIWLQGCVHVTVRNGSMTIYEMTKKEQLMACETLCHSYKYFLTNRQRCFCSDVSVGRKVAMATCPLYYDVFMEVGTEDKFDDYYILWERHDEQNSPVGNLKDQHCVTKGKNIFLEVTSCQDQNGFTCAIENGSNQTYAQHIPGFNAALSWVEANAFCSSKANSTGLASVPDLKHIAIFEGDRYWTSLVRNVTWSKTSYYKRKPRVSYVANDLNIYPKNSTDDNPFICSFDVPTCGLEISGVSGIISSPEYRASLFCKWRILVPVGMVVHLELADLDVELSDSCIYDRVTITDNVGPEKSFCGQKRGVSLTTRSNTINMVYRTDDTVQSKGFVMKWQAVIYDDAEESTTKSAHRITGGTIAGIVVGVIFLIFLTCFLSCCLKSEEMRRNVISCCRGHVGLTDKSKTPQVSNVLYGVNSFSFGSEFTDGNTGYDTIGDAHHGLLLRNVSYANNPSKVSRHTYEDIENDMLTRDHYADIENDMSNMNEQNKPEQPGAMSKREVIHTQKKNTVKITVDMMHENVHPNEAEPLDYTDDYMQPNVSRKKKERSFASDDGGYLNDDVTGKPKHIYLELKRSGASVSANSGEPDTQQKMATENHYVAID
ncbi:uncharacterized protein LOC127860998 [Dreissena polymorpha]|uniref:CUB domain-containing protein n=1 Tax=Dreissena polymorpha TaxID=45954 RepID=A0A9D3YP50_DREPO|nr:uncharacterized protein LOC127860998 [Dreissena polymorpha]KAH3704437.1 hypothetical protein DPMN_079493 [Dreissena polymorpha]